VLRAYNYYGFVGTPQDKFFARSKSYYVGLMSDLSSKGPDPWMPLLKYKICAFFAYHTDTEQPTPLKKGEKSYAMLIGSRPERFLVSFKTIRRFGDKLTDLWNSFLDTMLNGVKRAVPRPSDQSCNIGKAKTIKKVFLKREKPPVLISLPSFPLPEGCAETSVCEFIVNAQDARGCRTFVPSRKPIRSSSIRPKGFSPISQAHFASEIRRRVFEIFTGCEFKLRDAALSVFPSTSANYIKSRNDGGSVLALLENPELQSVLINSDARDDYEHFLRLCSLVFYEERVLSDDEKHYQLNNGSMRKEFKIVGWTSDDKPIVNINYIEKINSVVPGFCTVDYTNLEEAYLRLFEKVFELTLKESADVDPVALQESLKVRVITKCPPLLMFIMKPLQKYMHSRMKKLKVFKLLGEEVSLKLIQDTFGSWAGCKFQSGDYQDATNCLESFFSNVAANAVADVLKFSPGYRKLYIRSLTGFSMSEANRFGDMFPYGRMFQENGQLMGSVSSFPILCIVNLAVCSIALERGFGTTYTINQLPLLINGDDCAFPANYNVNEIWKRTGIIAGLSPSLGKCYHTKDFIQINSRRFLVHDTYFAYIQVSVEPVIAEYYELNFSRVLYINLGLFEGVSRSGSCSDEDLNPILKVQSLSARQHDLMKNSPIELREMLRAEFESYNRSLIEQSGLPKYVSNRFGGLGLVGEPNAQEKVKIKLMTDNNRSLPLKFESDWLIMKPVQAFYDSIPVSCKRPLGDEEMSEDPEFIKMILFGHNSLSKIFRDMKPKERQKCRTRAFERLIKTCQKIWKEKTFVVKDLKVDLVPRFCNITGEGVADRLWLNTGEDLYNTPLCG